MKYYITTPIYYVNDMPHIGHAYTTIAADVLARWYRLKNDEVYFLTGTDEHGAKIAQAAAKAGQSPKEFCDRIVDGFKAAWKDLNISNDSFLRTTDPLHERAVQKFLGVLYSSGNIYKSKYQGLYCVQCEKFLSETDLNADLCCPDHQIKPVVHAEENYFFRLSAFRDRLLERITDENHPEHIAVSPPERRNEVIGKLKTGLEDISISRAALEWGIPLPFDPKQTVYVWVDALLNYITALGYAENSETFQKFWPADLQLMAKDILWFHSIIWPAMLLAAGLRPPKRVFAHGFFTIEGQKMSKSVGNVIRPHDLIQRFGADASRYLTLSLFPFGTDGDISWAALTERYNADLANNLGNLVARTLTMVEKYAGGETPGPSAHSPALSIAGNILSQLSIAEMELENVKFHNFISALQVAIDQANRYIEFTAPWKMAKENNPELPTVLFNLLSNLKIVAVYVLPFMPRVSREIWLAIGETEPIEAVVRRYFSDKKGNKELIYPRPGAVVRKGPIMFPRIK